MVRLRGPLLSLEASKQLAKTLIFKTKAGRSFLTKYNYPGSKKHFTASAGQETQRTQYTTIVEAWQALSAGEKAIYNNRANGKKYSGWNLFFKEYEAVPAEDWLGTWAKRIEITIPNDNIDNDLTHFPVLLKLGTSVGTGNTDVSCIFDELASDENRKKIAVTKSDKLTEIYVEIEKWDDENEQAWLWVSKSDLVLSSSGETTLYLYYDANHADNDTYVADAGSRTEVWDSHFRAVYHLGEASGTIIDSTDNDVDSVDESLNEYEASGKVNGAADFELDSQNKIDFGDVNSLDGMAGITNECWVKPESLAGMMRMANKEDVFYSWIEDTPLFGGGVHGAAPNIWADTAPQIGIWNYVAFTWENETNLSDIYIDGLKDADTVETDGDPMPSSAHPFSIGARKNAGLSWRGWFDGIIDEVRISDIKRGAAYIKANFYTQTDALISWGSEETKP